jgi:hypothetical protein
MAVILDDTAPNYNLVVSKYHVAAIYDVSQHMISKSK